MTTYPKINLNGSDAATLIAGYRKAINATYKLQEAMAEITPHGRDYQTAPEHHYGMAREEFDQHRANINATMDYLNDVALNIMRQLDGADKAKALKAVIETDKS